MAISRLRFTQTKETAIAKQLRRQMADLLAQGKESNAKIRVENIIRQDIRVELLEYLELYCELLSARVGLLEQKECDPGLVEAVKTIIYAAPHAEIKELSTIRELLIHKYGPEFAIAAKENADGAVAQRIVDRCQVKAPSEELVVLYLTEIARAYDVTFSEAVVSEKEASDDEGSDGGEKEEVPAIEILDINDEEPPRTSVERRLSGLDPKSITPISVKPPAKTVDNRKPEVKVPSGVQVRRVSTNEPQPKKASAEDDFDLLKKRFEALKKK
ncbi:hypothetical protein BABINDRAFT_161244 [Babjeviella inositovora NRRL Y-12698]|uniref:DUF292-domain-containing protein n=1 Tax=Babjeviella inositovora NRRL Y-12698 TaxID=984486 RepID=A0A1E3QRJ9_9ASCO|nr:uncharacterized protein BABINDRAFT_161244 [Babjeviella inositovora NRRL Y-12698]ODQ80280.1 hypothetical protein BABINDRAFT_161244 [Babjeviella inositovora NRRL Y-12698]